MNLCWKYIYKRLKIELTHVYLKFNDFQISELFIE